MLVHQLDAIGFHADAADDGEEALELFLSGRYAIVLTDLHMPRLDGYELARAIRRHEADDGRGADADHGADARTSCTASRERCREAGMDDFAAKPTTIPLLAAKLRQWLPHLAWPDEARAKPAASRATSGRDGPLDPPCSTS